MDEKFNKSPIDIINKRKELWKRYHDLDIDRSYMEAISNYMVTSAGEELRKAIRNEPRLLIEMFFVIVDKNMETIPFFLNDVQREFSNILYQAEADFKAGKVLNIKFLVLKGRQQGFSAYVTTEQLARSLVIRNFAGFTIADCVENTAVLFEDKAKFPYGHLPDLLRPTEKFNNRRELHFEKLNSRWRIATASKDIGRSKTVNFLHLSECAFFNVLISDIQAAIGEALTKDAVQVFESTANGHNEYKDAWDSGSFINCFFAWWRTSEYIINFVDPKKESWFEEQLDLDYGDQDFDVKNEKWVFKRCQWLRNKKGLNLQQLYWYYNKWDNYIDKEKIKQEYPCSADEAFLASGRCVFNTEKVIERKDFLEELYKKSPPKKGEFRFEWSNPDVKDFIKDGTIKFRGFVEGVITIYEEVRPGYPYVIGGDTKGDGRDFYSAVVINNVTGKRVATIRGEFNYSKPYTWQVYCLGKYYNNALTGIETNFNTAPIEELERLHYPRQYMREHYDSISGSYMMKYGWRTDGNNRPLVIDKEVDLIENNIDLFFDITHLDECLTFVYDKNNRPDAESGKHDDLLIGDMIANEIRPQQSFIAEEILDDDEEDDEDEDNLMEENWLS